MLNIILFIIIIIIVVAVAIVNVMDYYFLWTENLLPKIILTDTTICLTLWLHLFQFTQWRSYKLKRPDANQIFEPPKINKIKKVTCINYVLKLEEAGK